MLAEVTAHAELSQAPQQTAPWQRVWGHLRVQIPSARHLHTSCRLVLRPKEDARAPQRAKECAATLRAASLAAFPTPHELCAEFRLKRGSAPLLHECTQGANVSPWPHLGAGSRNPRPHVPRRGDVPAAAGRMLHDPAGRDETSAHQKQPRRTRQSYFQSVSARKTEVTSS